MRICGLNRTTLLDYPGRVACTIFVGGCNYRCPFCQNGGLVMDAANQPVISEEEVLSFLRKRQGILEGVCVTGGEPTLQKDLPGFLEKIRMLGYDVKLDTNGTRPEVVKSLAKEGLITKVAMDIKTAPDQYTRLAGIEDPCLKEVMETAGFLLHGDLDYEFRTTVIRELHSEQDFEAIGEWLAGAKEYYLQEFRDSDQVLVQGLHGCSLETMERYRDILRKTMSEVGIRGID
jgi:pyruvate formate lyase activating enzyme